MRKILTYATPVFEHCRQWRGKCGEIRVVDKVGMYTYHQIVHGFKQGASGREGHSRIGCQFRTRRDAR
jgi:hypothetical protein